MGIRFDDEENPGLRLTFYQGERGLTFALGNGLRDLLVQLDPEETRALVRWLAEGTIDGPVGTTFRDVGSRPVGSRGAKTRRPLLPGPYRDHGDGRSVA